MTGLGMTEWGWVIEEGSVRIPLEMTTMGVEVLLRRADGSLVGGVSFENLSGIVVSGVDPETGLPIIYADVVVCGG